jgi:hypothetical protein
MEACGTAHRTTRVTDRHATIPRTIVINNAITVRTVEEPTTITKEEFEEQHDEEQEEQVEREARGEVGRKVRREVEGEREWEGLRC